MFNSARLKLTAWYLLTIMLISVSFSLVFYRVQIAELERFARAQRLRIERGLYGVMPGSGGPVIIVDPQLINETERRLAFFLIFVNGVILITAGGVGYFLAGRTLRPIQEMVEEQNRFIGDASHELRTPLTSLKSAMEVNLRDSGLSIKEARQLLADSLNEVNKLQTLSEGLLQLAQHHKPDVSKSERVSLAVVVKEAIRKIEPLAGQRKIRLESKVTSGWVEGRQLELEQLLVILLDNAVKYSREGGKVTVSAKTTDGQVRVSVADRGVGINRNDLAHIFDRFYRADSARQKSGAGGYGLGLAIAKKIVDGHRGLIKVQSKPEKGSTFTVFLPVKQSTFS